MKQTAVDWLVNEIDMQYPEINVRRKEWMVDKAKEMEKEQIEYAFYDGKSNGLDISNDLSNAKEITSEQYYKEAYQ